jgi:hypothetical protein
VEIGENFRGELLDIQLSSKGEKPWGARVSGIRTSELAI